MMRIVVGRAQDPAAYGSFRAMVAVPSGLAVMTLPAYTERDALRLAERVAGMLEAGDVAGVAGRVDYVRPAGGMAWTSRREVFEAAIAAGLG